MLIVISSNISRDIPSSLLCTGSHTQHTAQAAQTRRQRRLTPPPIFMRRQAQVRVWRMAFTYTTHFMFCPRPRPCAQHCKPNV